MGAVVDDNLPVALGVAISPVPIIAVILMLLAPRAEAAAFGRSPSGIARISSSSVAVPVVAYAAAPARIQGPLDELRVWLTDHNAAVMSVLLLVIGVAILGKGLGAL